MPNSLANSSKITSGQSEASPVVSLAFAVQDIWAITARSCFHCCYKTEGSVSIPCSQLPCDVCYYTAAIYHSSYSAAQYPAICLALKMTAKCPVVSAVFASRKVVTCLIRLHSVVNNSNCHWCQSAVSQPSRNFEAHPKFFITTWFKWWR